MKITVSEMTVQEVRQLAKEVHHSMIPSYTFDGYQLETVPEIQLRDTIIQRMIYPRNLLRVQLNFPEDGPDDKWYAAWKCCSDEVSILTANATGSVQDTVA